MISERMMRLINAEMDGSLSARGRKKLEQAARVDPEVRQVRRNMQIVCERLESVDTVEPPPGLKDDIIRQLPTHRYPARVRTSFLTSLVRMITERPRLQLSGAFAAGFAVALVVMTFVVNWPTGLSIDRRAVTGTLAKPDRLADYSIVDSRSVPIAGWQVEMAAYEASGTVVVRLAVSGAAEDPVKVAFTHDNMILRSLAQVAGVSRDIYIDANTAHFSTEVASEWQMSLEQAAAAVPAAAVRLECGDQEFSTSLQLMSEVN